MVLRIRELAVQMANGIYEDTPDRDNAHLEVTALIDQVSLIAGYTRFNDISLLNGSFDSVEIQAGNTTTEKIVVTIDDMTASGLSIQAATIATQAGAQAAITTMDTALETIATEQATLGSLINRFSFSVNNLSKASVATEQAVGRIMDADFASETTNLSKQQILNQAATSMLAQANQSKQSILALLQ